jgi:hypothetical protein
MNTRARRASSILGASIAVGLLLAFPSTGSASRSAGHKLPVVRAIILAQPLFTQPGLIKFVPSTAPVGRVKIEVVNHDTRFHTFESNGAAATPKWMVPRHGKGMLITTFKRPGRYFGVCDDAQDQGISGILTIKRAG